MAKFANGITGPFSGKIGPVIGSSWKGIPYMKGRYKDRTKRVGMKEKTNRNKFAMAQTWLKPILTFVREGFKNYSPTVEGFLAAKSGLLLNSFEGIPPDIFINPALVKVSHGTLPLSENIKAEKNGDLIQFSWNPGPVPGGYPRDQVMILIYDVDNRDVDFATTGQFRETGMDVLKMSPVKNLTYHAYLAFSASDRSSQSDSVYLGAFNSGE